MLLIRISIFFLYPYAAVLCSQRNLESKNFTITIHNIYADRCNFNAVSIRLDLNYYAVNSEAFYMIIFYVIRVVQ